MKSKAWNWVLASAGAAALCLVGVRVGAHSVGTKLDPAPLPDGIFDHLMCYPIKDPQLLNNLSLRLFPHEDVTFAPLTPDGGYGCIVRSKASEICIDIRKQPAGTDAGPNAPNGTPNAGDFLCYKAKCLPRLIDRPIDVTDQFGARQITVKFFAGPRKVCTPILSKPVE
jgi:hypothetical protein